MLEVECRQHRGPQGVELGTTEHLGIHNSVLPQAVHLCQGHRPQLTVRGTGAAEGGLRQGRRLKWQRPEREPDQERASAAAAAALVAIVALVALVARHHGTAAGAALAALAASATAQHHATAQRGGSLGEGEGDGLGVQAGDVGGGVEERGGTIEVHHHLRGSSRGASIDRTASSIGGSGIGGRRVVGGQLCQGFPEHLPHSPEVTKAVMAPL
mmetsp:Transcript_178195/g.571207  ORF Transcript_178195/g.571207 Transcript_178195/m.571207 type:complete len:213 (+) Transcript_178195:27-665(+)